MSSDNLIPVALCGAVTFVAVVSLLADGAPIYSILELVAVIAGTLWLTLFIRFRLIASDDKGEPQSKSPSAKCRARMIVFGILAAVTLLISEAQLMSPAQANGRELSWASALTAVFLACLSFREFRRMRQEELKSPLPAVQNIPANRSELGKPKYVLIGILIFGALFIIGNLRRILTPSESKDVWIGVAQMVIWLPILSYFAFREYRRAKKAPKSGL